MLADRERRLLLDNPDLFILRYFGHKIRKLEDFHLRLLDTATKQSRGLVLYPAAHGKTTLVSTCLPIWALCRDPNIRIAVILKNDTDAQGIGQAILAELMGNQELIRDFGPFKPEGEDDKSFALSKISVAKRTRRSKEPTIAFFGAGSRSALGHRTDWTICDDIITDLNSATPQRRESVKEWFMQGPATMGEFADSRLTVVGTLFDPEDLYHDLAEMTDPETGQPIYTVQREDAIVDEEARTTLWAEKWPYRRLMERKAEMGTLDFNKRYRNIAVDKSRMVFREEYVKGGWVGKQKYPGCLDRSYKLGDFDESWRRMGGIDPAIGVSRSKKFTAHITLAQGSCKDHERCFWVVDIEREQYTLPQQVDIILGKHEQYALQQTVIEANSYQVGLFQAVQQKMHERGVALKVVPHYTTRTNKPDPELGVQAMAPYFENGQVHIPWGDTVSQRKMAQLVEELVMYPDYRTTDTVMAFWFVWKALQETAPRFTSFSRLAKESPRTARYTRRRRLKNPHWA